MREADDFDYVVTNDDVERAVAQLVELVELEVCSGARRLRPSVRR